MVTAPGIATLLTIGSDKYTAELLIDNSVTPVCAFVQGTKQYVTGWLANHYPNIAVVQPQVYLCELDHIKLFRARS